MFLISCIGSFEVNSRGICHYDYYKFTNDKFQCSDGSKWISINEFNDNYCDCSDHSDEPGTSACNSTFCCLNSEYRHFILSSKYVDDGVCDCCDGSDESTIKCPNTCKNLKAKETEILDKRLSVLKEANSYKKELLNESVAKKNEIESNLVKNKQRLTELNSEMEKTNVLLDDLKLRMNAAIEHFKRTKELMLAKDFLKDLNIHIKSLNGHFDKLQTDEDIELFYKNYKNLKSNKTTFEIIDFLKSLNEILEKPHDIQNMHESKEEHINNSMETKNDDNPNHEIKELNKENDLHHEYEENNPEEIITEKNVKEANSISDEEHYDEQTLALIKEYKNVEDQVKIQKSEMTKLENFYQFSNTIKSIDFGESNIYFSLYEKCFSINHDEYYYELCFFKSLNQKSGSHSISLGKWKAWEKTNNNRNKIMIFEDGDSCWNGKKRSSKVIVKCGKETKLLTASEPSMCQYEIVASTPIECQQIPESVDNNFIDYVMGNDEL